MSKSARELICLAGRAVGFAAAADMVARFCGWRVSEQTVRRTCQATGADIERWRAAVDATATPTAPAESAPTALAAATPTALATSTPTAPAESAPTAPAAATPTAHLSAAFGAAEGLVEFLTDGVKVNTTASWKELRIALFLKRPAGEAAQPWEWDTRKLPRPTARVVLAAIESAEEFALRWRPWAAALGITATAAITVCGDGAEWIWHQSKRCFPDAEGVLDVYHAMEHVAGTARELFGEGTGAALAWTDAGRRLLIAGGWTGITTWVGRMRDECGQSEAAIHATEKLIAYFVPHYMHLDYRGRLEAGRTIGSGAVEGAIKQVVTRRLKQTGARWRPENAVRMVTLCSTALTDDWDAYWQSNTPSLAI